MKNKKLDQFLKLEIGFYDYIKDIDTNRVVGKVVEISYNHGFRTDDGEPWLAGQVKKATDEEVMLYMFEN